MKIVKFNGCYGCDTHIDGDDMYDIGYTRMNDAVRELFDHFIETNSELSYGLDNLQQIFNDLLSMTTACRAVYADHECDQCGTCTEEETYYTGADKC